MEKLRFKFVVLGSTDGKSNTICVTSIETPDGRIFEIPDDLKPASKHTSIVYSDFYAKIRNSLKKTPNAIYLGTFKYRFKENISR